MTIKFEDRSDGDPPTMEDLARRLADAMTASILFTERMREAVDGVLDGLALEMEIDRSRFRTRTPVDGWERADLHVYLDNELIGSFTTEPEFLESDPQGEAN